jgi:hypothetical protein
LARWRKEHDRQPVGLVCADCLQALLQRPRHHHHAGPAAEGTIVHAAIVALGEIARVPQPHVDQLRFVGTARHARDQERREQLGEQGDDVEAHGNEINNPVASPP